MDLAFQPLQLSCLPAERRHQCLGAGKLGCFGCNWIVLKQLRICTTEDKVSSHCTPPVSFVAVAQEASKQRHWIQLTSPSCEPQSGRDGAELQRTTGYQMLHLTVLGILPHLSSTKIGGGGDAWHLPAPLLLSPHSERNVLTTSKIIVCRGENCLLPYQLQYRDSSVESLNQPRTGTVIRTILQHFPVVSQVSLPYPIETLFLN